MMKTNSCVRFISSFLALILASPLAVADDITGPPAAPEGWTDGFVMTNGIRIHYWRTGAGSGKPVMVMAHGSSDYGLCWTQLATEVEDDFDIILPDARGHGLSDQPSLSDRADAQVEDLAGLVRELGLEHPVMMGHSMGSASLAWFAARYPDLPRAVILEDPGLLPRLPGSGSHAEAQYRNRLKIIHRNNLPHETLVAQCMKGHPGWGLAECQIWARSKHYHHPDTAYVSREGRPPMSELFDAITAPTLILKADDEGERRTRNEEVAGHLQNGRIVHIEGAKHNVRRDAKARVVEEMNAFISKL